MKENKRFKLKHFDVITIIDDYRSENNRYVNMQPKEIDRYQN